MQNSKRASVGTSSPGKLGDLIYSLPAIKEVARLYGPVDFFTSEYCRPLKRLLEYQSFINSFNIPEHYVVENFGCGGQPWDMRIEGYDKVFQFGFRTFPTYPIDQVFFDTYNLEYKDFIGTLEYPKSDNKDKYIVVAPRKDEVFRDTFIEFMKLCPLPVIQIGTTDEYIPGYGIDKTGLDFLETTTLIAESSGYFGVLSALGGIAQSFGIPKVLLGSGAGWDMRHVRYTTDNFYPTHPANVIEVLNFLNLEIKMKTYSKTLNVEDYDYMPGYVQHIKNIQGVLTGIPARFEHQHRYWEYALALKVIDEQKSQTVLDVGGGGSVFAPAASWVGHKVTVVDNGDVGDWINQQNERIGKTIEFLQEDFIDYKSDKFDAVVCLSVIEHVPNNIEFFNKLLDNVKEDGVLVLTTDFHPSGVQIVGGHITSYNKESLTNLLNIATKRGFTLLNGDTDYDYFEPNVNGCTFSSLVLKNTGLKQIKKNAK